MTRRDRAKLISAELARLFPDTPVPLDHCDAFTLLIAVLLSAQCTDVRVNQVTPHLFKIGGTPEAMSEIPVETIQKIIRPCGLAPQKARAIFALSRILLEKYSGKVPTELSDLESLPGVGHKTASVVLVQAFGIPAFPVDTHIHRLAFVWGLSSGKNVVQTERDLKALFPEKDWASLHLRIIFYGREICPSRNCDGLRCALCQSLFPKRRKPLRGKNASL
jgi:endonuclease III